MQQQAMACESTLSVTKTHKEVREILLRWRQKVHVIQYIYWYGCNLLLDGGRHLRLLQSPTWPLEVSYYYTPFTLTGKKKKKKKHLVVRGVCLRSYTTSVFCHCLFSLVWWCLKMKNILVGVWKYVFFFKTDRLITSTYFYMFIYTQIQSKAISN